MDDQAQKRYFDARKRFADAKSVLSDLGMAIQPTKRAVHPSPEWYTMTIVGHTCSHRWSGNVEQFNPSKWPTGEQVAKAWIECNQAFADFMQAYKNLKQDDRDYIQARAPEP